MVATGTRLVVMLLGLRNVNEFVDFLYNNRKLSICQVVTRWPLQMPANPPYTTGGRRHVGEVLGEGWASSVCSDYPHLSRGGTSADDFDRFLIVAVVNWCLWRNFYHGKLKTPDIGFKVTRPIDALVGLYCQRREDAVLTLQILLNGG